MEAAFFFFFAHDHPPEKEWIKVCRTDIRLDDQRFGNYTAEDREKLGLAELERLRRSIQRAAAARGVRIRLVDEIVKKGSIIGSYSIEIHSESFTKLTYPGAGYSPALSFPGVDWKEIEPHVLQQSAQLSKNENGNYIASNNAMGAIEIEPSPTIVNFADDGMAKAPSSHWKQFKEYLTKDGKYGPIALALTWLVMFNDVAEAGWAAVTVVKNVVTAGIDLYQNSPDALPVIGHQTRRKPVIELPKAVQDAYGVKVPYINPGRTRELKNILMINPVFQITEDNKVESTLLEV